MHSKSNSAPKLNQTVRGYPMRLLKNVFGLFLFANGICMAVRANIGIAPWDTFAMGISLRTGLTIGAVTILTGVAILVFVLLFKEKIGVGTILNTLLIGTFMDLILALPILPEMNTLPTGILMLLGGQFSVCVGSYFYIGAGMGCGPRDSLMVALAKRLPRVPIGVIRGAIEGSALLAGWLMGAKIGVGSVIAIFGIGFIFQFTMWLFRFDVTAVEHEGIFETARILHNAVKKESV